jgi:hypothetical protein
MKQPETRIRVQHTASGDKYYPEWNCLWGFWKEWEPLYIRGMAVTEEQAKACIDQFLASRVHSTSFIKYP